MTDTVQEIKERLSIVDVVAPYVKLTKAGRHYKGRCPFHQEKTPSFMVSVDRGFYHCFGCGKGGDMFTFIEELEGLDFKGALRLLAEKAGVVVTQEDKGARDSREKAYAALEAATLFFEKRLEESASAKAYLKTRGISEKTLSAFRVGYAPDEWRLLSDALKKEGHAESVLFETGLVKKPEKGEEGAATRYYDRFRGRIMFPIRDVSGRVIGFSGRIFPHSDAGAKYLNSPETEFFQKSRILYGLDSARQGVRKFGFALLVEGQIDLLSAFQAGYTNVVALSGTAFTGSHAALIKRYTENLLIAFDGDRAGVAAALRAGEIALRGGLSIKIATLPEGQDPADVVQGDPLRFKEVVKTASHLIDFALALVKKKEHGSRRVVEEASRTVVPYLSLLSGAILRDHFVHRIAEELGVSEDAVREEAKKHTSKEARSTAALSSGPVPAPLSRIQSLERLIVGIMLASEEAGAFQGRLKKRFEEIVGSERARVLCSEESSLRSALLEGDLFLDQYTDPAARESVIDTMLDDLKKELCRIHYQRAVTELRLAEREGDTSKVQLLMEEVSALAREL